MLDPEQRPHGGYSPSQGVEGKAKARLSLNPRSPRWVSVRLHLTPPEQGEGCVGMDSLPHGMRPALALALVSELLSVWLSSI